MQEDPWESLATSLAYVEVPYQGPSIVIQPPNMHACMHANVPENKDIHTLVP